MKIERWFRRLFASKRFAMVCMTEVHALSGEALATARHLYLVALQIACERDDFGELFEGRT